MIQSEKSTSNVSSTRPKNYSFDLSECIGDFMINIPYENFYVGDELNNLKNFYEM